jgi:hypothetical protein
VITSYYRPTKYIWHGAGQEWGVSDASDLSPPGTCNEWRSDSPLAVGLASKLGDPSSYLLAPQRVHCNKELVVLCIESTSPSSVYARRKRSVRHSVGLKHDMGEELSPSEYEELLSLVDQDIL